MSGIDKIVNGIIADAQSRADEILDQARKTADEEMAKADKKCGEVSEQAAAATRQAVANYEERIRSQCEQETELAHLSAKQEIIDGILSKAFDRLKNLDTPEYFEMLGKLLGSVVRSGEGEMAFSAADLSRLPAGFIEKANEIASSKGGTLKLAEKPADIDSGFILRYGQVEENCSLTSVFAEKKDALQDKVSSIMW